MKSILFIFSFCIVSCTHKPNAKQTSRTTDSATNTQATIDRDAVRAAMRRALPQFKDCYISTFKSDKQYPNGKLTLTWQIHEAGIVHYAQVKEDSSTLRNQNLESCMLSVLQKLQMPPPPPDTIAEVAGYPFVFSGSTSDQNDKDE